MREPLKDRERLEHILNAIDVILDKSQNLTYESLTADKVQFGGIVYYTLIIGEAAYNLTKVFKRKYPTTNWTEIERMRHNLVHGYYNVDPEIVWSVIQNDLHPLRQQVSRYLAEIDWDAWEKTEFVIKESAVHKNLIQTAERMKKRGYDTEEICKITGLNRDEIERL
ncbi:MAG: DUF86 domain-containing protein [Bacteroidales bacterium]|nr:DUF86 domain-containing protein [Bacteroidales bacterium]